MPTATKVKSYVANNHLVVKVCYGDSSTVKLFNLGWAKRLAISLKDDGNQWVISAEYKADGSGGETEEIAQFRDQKHARKAFCAISSVLKCRSQGLLGAVGRTALLTMVAVLVVIVTLFLAGSVMTANMPLQPFPGPLAMKNSSQDVDPALLQLLLTSPTAQKASPTPSGMTATPKEPYGVPLSADEVLGAH